VTAERAPNPIGPSGRTQSRNGISRRLGWSLCSAGQPQAATSHCSLLAAPCLWPSIWGSLFALFLSSSLGKAPFWLITRADWPLIWTPFSAVQVPPEVRPVRWGQVGPEEVEKFIIKWAPNCAKCSLGCSTAAQRQLDSRRLSLAEDASLAPHWRPNRPADDQ